MTYQICTRCVMDTSDPDISFDNAGVCSHCQDYDIFWRGQAEWAKTPAARDVLLATVRQIKQAGKGRDYDCIIGISGGVDSTYVALRVKELGLRPLAVHFDSGWNSELAVSNIENLVKRLDINLFTVVADWEEMRDLQLAFFKASLANCDIPQDHAFLATLYRLAAKHKIRYFIGGGNIATESILPFSWGYNASDLRHLKAIHRRFGTRKLKTYPTLSFFDRYVYYRFVRRIQDVRLLNMMPYDKVAAKREITEKLGWRDYGGKHYESIFTRYFQSSYLVEKFGFDKRRAHFASLILADQMTRDEALRELQSPPIDPRQAARDKTFVAKKLGCDPAEFEQILARPPRSYRDYPSNRRLFEFKRTIRVHHTRKRAALKPADAGATVGHVKS